MTRRTLIKRALAALASVPVLGKCFAEPMTRTPEEVATQTFRAMGELQQCGCCDLEKFATFTITYLDVDGMQQTITEKFDRDCDQHWFWRGT